MAGADFIGKIIMRRERERGGGGGGGGEFYNTHPAQLLSSQSYTMY